MLQGWALLTHLPITKAIDESHKETLQERDMDLVSLVVPPPEVLETPNVSPVQLLPWPRGRVQSIRHHIS